MNHSKLILTSILFVLMHLGASGQAADTSAHEVSPIHKNLVQPFNEYLVLLSNARQITENRKPVAFVMAVDCRGGDSTVYFSYFMRMEQ